MKREEIATNTYNSGYNCAQSVISSFVGEQYLDMKTALKLSSCFGGGMRMGATCGALTGALMVLGLEKGYSEYSPEAKAEIDARCISLIDSWKKEIGRTDCREILGVDVSDPHAREQARDDGLFEEHCPHCIRTAVRLLEKIL